MLFKPLIYNIYTLSCESIRYFLFFHFKASKLLLLYAQFAPKNHALFKKKKINKYLLQHFKESITYFRQTKTI